MHDIYAYMIQIFIPNDEQVQTRRPPSFEPDSWYFASTQVIDGFCIFIFCVDCVCCVVYRT